MIVRTWHGIVPEEKAEGFRVYLLKTGISHAKATPGNIGAYMFNRSQAGFEHFYMISYWQDMEAIKAFAGPYPQIAVTYPEDSLFGLISDPLVLHHEVNCVNDDFSLYIG